MPVVTAASKSLPLTYGQICEQQWYCSRLATSALIITIILAVLFLPRQTGRRQFPKRLRRVSPAWQDIITWTPRAPCSSISLNCPSVSEYGVPLKQGQGAFKKQAYHAVSRGGASGTALVGLDESCEGGGMEEEKRVSAGVRSRGVSTHWNDGAGLSGSLPSPDQLPATAEQSGHVETSLGNGAVGFHEEQDNMGNALFGELVGANAGPGLGATPEARGRISTSFFGEHMADDEHILYGVKQPSYTASANSKWSSNHRGTGLDFARSSPSTLNPADSPAAFSPGLTIHGSHLEEGIAIPSILAAGSRPIRGNDREALDGKDRAIHRPEDGASPSSYPPKSPLLPPPPPATHGDFDHAAVMFPGPARDGGIRVVPAHHNHGEGGASNLHVQVASSSESPGSSWTRHTRVFGGGVCLACAAAAAGEGGFYGDSVRPEDKRR